jgi:hypothetical protein
VEIPEDGRKSKSIYNLYQANGTLWFVVTFCEIARKINIYKTIGNGLGFKAQMEYEEKLLT